MDWTLIALPIAIWCLVRLVTSSAPREMDFDTGHGTFAIMLGVYLKFAGAMVAVGLGMALFSRWQHDPDGVTLTCLAGALCAFFFALHLAVRFEWYLHSRYLRSGIEGRSNYSANQYALTHALGWSAVAFVALGTGLTVWLAWAS